MITELIVATIMLQPEPQQTEQELQKQRQQIERVQRQLEDQEKLLGNVRKMLEDDQKKALCTAELRWVSGSETRIVPPSQSAAVQLNLFSTVSKPSETCLPGEIRITASYLDAGDNLICSGGIEDLAIQHSQSQPVNLEIKPWNLREFGRWRNEPPVVNSGAKRLVCLNPEGVAEATLEELARVASVRVRTTIFSGSGGMSTVEVVMKMQR
jgi:hypothetical protein